MNSAGTGNSVPNATTPDKIHAVILVFHRDKLYNLLSPFIFIYPLIPSMAIPSTRYLWKMIKNTTIGISEITDIANNPP